MERGVLLGGRTALRARSRTAYLALVWVPVLVMLLVIVRESTDGFSSMHTGAMLRPLLEAIAGPIGDDRWETIHHVLRKTGHFLGYGTLGLTWLRAWLLTWLMPLRLRSTDVWRRWALQMAICCTAVVASLDELHQTHIPSRTGLATDVLLDTFGALVLCGLTATCWQGRLNSLQKVAS